MLVGLCSTGIVYAWESWEYTGWINAGKPQYTYSRVDSSGNLTSYTSLLNKADVSGSNIMARLKKSYTLRYRASKITDAKYMQRQLYTFVSQDRDNYNYSKVTYKDCPYGGVGYTEWYDSPSGLFLDYEHQFARYTNIDDKGKVVDSDVGVDIVKDSIYYNRVQYPSIQEKAFIATNNSALADAKTASILQRNGKNYPIYLNNGRTLDNNVYQELKNKGIKDIYLLGGDTTFEYTAGMTNKFNVIRVGGLTREETKELLKKMPTKIESPQHYESDDDGYVMQGVPFKYQNIIKEKYLIYEKNEKSGANLIAASKYLSDIMTIGSEPNQTSTPTMVIGINDGNYEAYWICYWNQRDTGYVYQFVLGGYYDEVKINSEITSVETSDTVYKQSNNIYWTALNKDININTRGTTNVKYDMEAIQINLNNSSFGTLENSPKHIMAPTEVNTSNFNSFTNTTLSRAVLGKYSGLNSITARHTFKAKEHNKQYSLYTAGQLGNWSEYIYSGIQLKTDGEPPVVTGIPSGEFKDAPFEFTIKAADLLSGVRSIKLTHNGKDLVGKDSITTTVMEEGQNKYVVTAIDNVGNTFTREFIINIDLGITIIGEVNPNPSPAGKKLTLDIKTTGKANKIKIVFPDELVKLSTVEDPLVFEKAVTVEPTHTERVFAWLPLETPQTLDKNNLRIKPAYKIYIEAENIYGKVASGYIDLDVKGSILDGLRYGIKATGYDRRK